MTTINPPAPPRSGAPEPVDEQGPPARLFTVGRLAAAAVSLGLVVMWIYVFVAAPSYHPNGWLKDRTFPKAAERICKATVKELDEVSLANTAKTPAQRAHLVDEATALLRTMQGELRTVIPDTKDAKYIRAWVEDWSTHLADRDDYAKRLRTDPDAEFLESEKGGGQLSAALDKFATDNEMQSCETRLDV